MKRVSLVFIALDVGNEVEVLVVSPFPGSPTRTKDGNEVRTVRVADRTGSINLSVWNEKGALIAPADLLQLIQGNTTVRNGCLTLNVGRFGQLIKIGEFCFPFVEQPDFSAYNEDWARQLVLFGVIYDFICFSYSISSSQSERDQSLRLLILQLQRPHSQIRLGALRVIQFLTCDAMRLPAGTPTSLAATFRGAVLLQLQDILPFCIPTTESDRPLPPPKLAAEELRQELLKLLLRWERDVASETVTLSKQAEGQLASAMRYLRTPVKQGGGTARLKEVADMLRRLELEHQEAEALRQRNAQTADAVIRRRIFAAKTTYREHKMAIEENIKSLETIIKLLVPDLFEMEAYQSPSPCQIDPREHGFLSQGRISVTFCVDFVNADETIPSDDLLPQLRIKLDDDVQLLRDSGQEFADLAFRCHRGILSEYMELANLFDANPNLVVMFEDDKADVGAYLTRLNNAVRRFSALTFYDETAKEESAAKGNDLRLRHSTICIQSSEQPLTVHASFETPLCVFCPAGGDDAGGTERPVSLNSEEEEEEDEEDDFIEVPSIHSSAPPTVCTRPTNDAGADNPAARPVARLTDRMPWETDAKPTSSLSRMAQQRGLDKARAKPLGVAKLDFASHGHRHRLWIRLYFRANRRRRIGPTHERPVESIVLPDGEARRVKVDESSHRFWKPHDVTEFERPETDHVEAAISLTTTPSRVSAETSVVDEPSIDGKTASEIAPRLHGLAPPLACWVPLPSGRLCPRRDPSGRCRIHGRVVLRHRVTGQPFRQADALRLEAEAISRVNAQVQARTAIERKRRRRRYPELEDIAGTEKTAARLLRHRLLEPKSLRRLGETLDEADRIEAKKSFTDNFNHTFSSASKCTVNALPSRVHLEASVKPRMDSVIRRSFKLREPTNDWWSKELAAVVVGTAKG
ncbi:unnamed protein product [Mesocestoides corti]|uniref:OB domain-containing protein n=1 Tax=Mesocestoides corti TaxID=53468 RepID=A0A0R3U858_MESCO|nr:unnamed protein product [Mesocestoides corti]